MTNWQVQCETCFTYGHEYPLGSDDPMLRKHPETHKYICLDCYKKEAKILQKGTKP